MTKRYLSTPQRDRLFPSFGRPIPRAKRSGWQWVDFPQTRAGSGKPTGLGLCFSPDPDTRTLVIYFQAGGACWNWSTASAHLGGYGAVFHLGGFTERTWRRSLMAKVHRRMWLFDRDDDSNPFRDAHFAYVPYCTGDIYVGDRTATFRGPLPFMKKTVHFRGQHNVREYLKRLVPTFPNLERVYLIGSSAGGYGASFSWWLANEAWRTVPIDVISDAGHPILFPKKKFDHWIDTWGPQLPDDGPECANGLREILEYSERRYLDPDRYALITTRKDIVISAFTGMSPRKHAEYIDELRETFFDNTAKYPSAAHARYFIMDHHGHTVFPGNMVGRAHVGPMQLKTWLQQMVAQDPKWRSWHELDGDVYSTDPPGPQNRHGAEPQKGA